MLRTPERPSARSHARDRDVIRIVADSRLLTGVEAAFRRARLAWLESKVEQGFGVVRSLSPADRVRALGAAAASATTVHMALSGPAHVLRLPLPELAWIAAGLLGVFSVVRPDAVVAAFHHSGVGRRWRRWFSARG